MGAKHTLQPRQHHRFVVHKQDALHETLSVTAQWASGVAPSMRPIGTETVNVVPRGRFGSKPILPPCFSTTMLRARVKPCPVPRPTSLVVKNGSKTRDRISAGMPHPVSLIHTVARSPSVLVFTRMTPLAPPSATAAMAWAAFT